MQFEVDIIQALQRLSNSFTDALWIVITQLGTEIVFMAIAVTLYWVIDKRFAHRFFNAYILSVAVNNFIKLGAKRVRPFNRYPRRVRSIGDPEATYSFPSGHTQSIAAVSSLLTARYGKRYPSVPVIGGVLLALVMVSRMYLGQHYLTDVLAGAALGVGCTIGFYALWSLLGEREEWMAVGAAALTVVTVAVMAGVGQLNTAGGVDLLKGLGAFLAFDAGYFAEKRYVGYDVQKDRIWWKVALRLAIGLGVAVGIQQGGKLILPQSIPMLYAFTRYFFMAAWASIGAPALFKAVGI